MRAFVTLGLFSHIPSEKTGLGKRLRNDPFCVERDVKRQQLAVNRPTDRDFELYGAEERPLFENLEEGDVGEQRRRPDERLVDGADVDRLRQLTQVTRQDPNHRTGNTRHTACTRPNQRINHKHV